MNRHEWEVYMPARELLAAARTKLKHHTERHAVWKKKEAEVMKVVKKKGLTIHQDQAAMMYTLSNKVAHGAQIMVDQQLQLDLNECHEKLHVHSNLIKDYSAWVEFLDHAKGDEEYSVRQPDYLFFFGR